MRPDSIDETCTAGVTAGAFPGAVVLAGNSEEILFHRAYGQRALVPSPLPMTPDTVFDLSSLTKPMATATAMMLLVRDGRVGLDDPVRTVIPELGVGAKAAITFRHFLNHTSGLPAWKPYYECVVHTSGGGPTRLSARRGHVFQQVHEEPLATPPGEKCCYSDLGFILLGEVIERISGQPLDRFCHDEIFPAMGLRSTFFVDLIRCAEERPRFPIAATEDCPWRRKILCGEVHDDNAFAMGGVAGHAGLFASAADVHRFIRFLGRCREGAEPDFLPAAVVREFLEADRVLPGQTHVLGWDTPSPGASSSGSHFSGRAVGHLGFTGTSIWWDLERDVHVVFLTNRVHPSRDNPGIREFRPLVHDAVMEGVLS